MLHEANLEKINLNEPKNEEIFKLAIFDLDNTLVPTSWIMEEWRSECIQGNDINLAKKINKTLTDANLFTVLERLCSKISEKVDKLIIVTNAGDNTVFNFYFYQLLPQLKELLDIYDIMIYTTRSWIKQLGPPPNQFEDLNFKEFYVKVKYQKFNEIFTEILSDQKNSNKKFEVIAVGDQVCEISAACRLISKFSDRVSLAKLIILDQQSNIQLHTINSKSKLIIPTFDITKSSLNLNFMTNSTKNPGLFVTSLYYLTDLCLWVINQKNVTSLENAAQILGNSIIRQSNENIVAHWIPMAYSISYCIGYPSMFPTDFPKNLPFESFTLNEKTTKDKKTINNKFLVDNITEAI